MPGGPRDGGQGWVGPPPVGSGHPLPPPRGGVFKQGRCQGFLSNCRRPMEDPPGKLSGVRVRPRLLPPKLSRQGLGGG